MGFNDKDGSRGSAALKPDRSRPAGALRGVASRSLAILGLGVAVICLLPSAASAIQMGCARSGQSVTCVYNDAENTNFTVPAGISQISVDVVGGTGGGAIRPSCAPLCGGAAARVDGPLAVTPSEVLAVEVASNASSGGAGYFSNGMSGRGGGGCYGGGGASAILTAGSSTPVVVAAGGGGDGCPDPGGADPETQGASAGASGATGPNTYDGQGGNPGVGTVAGLGGAGGGPAGPGGFFGGVGNNGSFGAGGSGGGIAGASEGGGGGGGLAGGGGGGGGGLNSGESAGGSAGGGGGGASLAAPGDSIGLDSTGTPLITISFVSNLSFTSALPPPATTHAFYDYTYTAIGDTDITYSATAGSLPPGLSLAASGELAGSPTVAGTFTYTVSASDGSTSVSRQDSITVAKPFEPPAQSTVALSCSPGTVLAGQSTVCVASVASDSNSGQPEPTGNVAFTSQGGGAFSHGGACALSEGDSSASCQVSFTPPPNGAGTYLISAAYRGNAAHLSADAATSVASAPIAGKTENVSVLSGRVLIELPNGAFVPLAAGTKAVPLSSTIDASKGIMRLVTSLNYPSRGNPHHAIATGTFSAGIFAAKQERARKALAHGKPKHAAVTDIILKGPKHAAQRAGCRRTGPPGKGIVQSLHGVAKGIYQTIGAASITSVTKGAWTVQDRCDGTLTAVTSGHATVTITRGKHRIINVSAGKTLLAKARFLQAKIKSS
jgi:hypothetical protein